ncbi:MAG: polyprenyl synthetase family protein [Chloroflexota bacterium]|nr:polyprenyl synthetase family protein [Chloroflexota bacterium]
MAAVSQTAEFEAAIEAELRDMFRSRELALYDMMTYHMGWGPDDIESPYQAPLTSGRIHGVACLTACEAAGGDVSACLPAAAAIEMSLAFLQIHDDVQSGSPQRAGRDAVWWKWGPAQAINAGDGMYAMARVALFRLAERGMTSETTFRAIQIFDETNLALCEGRYQDLEARERIDLSVDAYLAMASDKRAALYIGAMKLGTLVAGADDAIRCALADFGSKVGLARQIQDDLNELWARQEASDEVLNKKKLLPLVYTVENADVSTKRRLGDIYFKRVLDAADVEVIRGILDEGGGRQFSEDMVGDLRRDALSAVDKTDLPASSKEMLNQLAASILSG